MIETCLFLKLGFFVVFEMYDHEGVKPQTDKGQETHKSKGIELSAKIVRQGQLS